MERELEKLISVYKEHKQIIVGLDFDGTIFPFEESDIEICERVKKLIKDLHLRGKIVICLYTVADIQSIKYKIELMKLWGITPNYINESPIKLGNGDKPYFNILLDDKAGLPYTYDLLREFKNKII